MTTIVQPWKKGYKVYFCDDAKAGKIKHVGTVELEETSKGIRPSEFFVRRPGTSHAGKTPTKEFITVLRGNGPIKLTQIMPEFQDFLRGMHLSWETTILCRTCLCDDHITPLIEETRIRCGQEYVCLDCAKRELRRELGHIKHLGKRTQLHIENLLEEYRDLDMVLAILQPESLDTKKTMFDRLEAHDQTPTERIEDVGDRLSVCRAAARLASSGWFYYSEKSGRGKDGIRAGRYCDLRTLSARYYGSKQPVFWILGNLMYRLRTKIQYH